MISRLAKRVAERFVRTAGRGADYADRLKSQVPNATSTLHEMWADDIRRRLERGKLGNEQLFKGFSLDFSDFSDQEVQEFLNHLSPPRETEPVSEESGSKVDARVKELRQNDEMTGGRYLPGLRGDFSILVEDPSDPVGGGEYVGWTPDEIRELYEKLYGGPMD